MDADRESEVGVEAGLDARRYKRWSLMVLVLLFSLGGILSELVPERCVEAKILDFVGTVTSASAIYAWCYFDSVQRGYRIGTRLRVVIILLAAVGIPVYFFKTRGVRGFISIGVAILFLCVLLAVAELSAFVVCYAYDRLFAGAP